MGIENVILNDYRKYENRVGISNSLYNRVANKDLSAESKTCIANILSNCNMLLNYEFSNTLDGVIAGKSKRGLLDFITIMSGVVTALMCEESTGEYLSTCTDMLCRLYEDYLDSRIIHNDSEATSEIQNKVEKIINKTK